jgi:acyl dehydratase
MSYGRWFEEFTVGEVIKHWPGRTITEADSTWFALLTMNQHPLHSDAHYAATHTQHGQRVVAGPLVFSIGIGMTVADVSGKAQPRDRADPARGADVHRRHDLRGIDRAGQARVEAA